MSYAGDVDLVVDLGGRSESLDVTWTPTVDDPGWSVSREFRSALWTCIVCPHAPETRIGDDGRLTIDAVTHGLRERVYELTVVDGEIVDWPAVAGALRAVAQPPSTVEAAQAFRPAAPPGR